MTNHHKQRLSIQTTVLFLLVLLATGCGQKSIYPVRGQLVDSDGKPITEMKGGAIEFEAVDGQTSANGSIDENGQFRLTTNSPGDGAHVGKNRVVVTRPYNGPDTPTPYVILPKYEKYDTSGLEVVVEPKNNVIELKVDRVKR